jgi:putative pyoverdin transport system ATP-binding/permease protein
MNSIIKKFFLMVIIILSFPILAYSINSTRGLTDVHDFNTVSDLKITMVESFVQKQMKSGKIPGVSIVIVNKDHAIYKNSFGFADIKSKIPVTEKTLFEIGSNSKAFTGLGILLLEQQGLLSLDDPVTKYLPWLEIKYKKKSVNITINQFLHHTSGVPFKTIASIPISDDELALEETVKTLVNIELDSYPGEKFSYATINYDVLGLVIEKICGQPFDQYIHNNILNNLGLNNTYIGQQHSKTESNLAKGYKLGFTNPVEYQSPIFKGNTPAGYFISNINDMEEWIIANINYNNISSPLKELIKKSHEPDRTVAPVNDGSSYAIGWNVYQQQGGRISHGGNNPNYSSFIMFQPEKELGIVILANLNSEYTQTIGNVVLDIINGNETALLQSDIYKKIDNNLTTAFIISLLFSLGIILIIFKLIQEFFKKQRKFINKNSTVFTNILSTLVFFSSVCYCTFIIPKVIFSGLTWNFVIMWGPISLLPTVLTILATVFLFSIYFILLTCTKKQDDKPIFAIAILSILSGMGNALIMFTTIRALNVEKPFENQLFLFFILGIIIYVYGQKLVRAKLITVTTDLIYLKRIEIVNKILNSPYFEFEKIEKEEIITSLNNDTNIVSNFPAVFINIFTSLVTLLFCFIYLGIINFYGLLISMLIITLATGLYFSVGRSANKLMNQTRDLQNLFFKFIQDLMGGIKELNINKKKQQEFKNDMLLCCSDFKEKTVQAGMGFVNVFVVGELLFTIVIGSVVFVFPLLFKGITEIERMSFVLIFLYMTGPVNGVLNSIPQILNIRISWNRIKELINNLSLIENQSQQSFKVELSNSKLEIELKNVEFKYMNNNKEEFTLGPINYIFKSGEIAFIAGGNGSGKSTLAKILTGLYKPNNGEIFLNGRLIGYKDLGQLYSVVFSDYHLFDKLYGIDHQNKENMIDEYLKLLKIEDKLQINNGTFSTTSLSSGQRKRLALLFTYLEDRKIILFDEWAADQDPEFRNFFYNSLLPGLKEKGKCVIVISHDDRYYNLSDKLFKLDMGKIIFQSSINDAGYK